MGSLLTCQGSHELQLIGAGQLCLALIVASLPRATEVLKYVLCTSKLSWNVAFISVLKKAKPTSAEDRVSFRWQSASQ